MIRGFYALFLIPALLLGESKPQTDKNLTEDALTPTTDLVDYIAPLLPIDTPLPVEMDTAFRRRLTNATLLAQEAAENSRFAKLKTFPWLGFTGLLLAGMLYTFWRKRPAHPKETIFLPKKSMIAYAKAGEILTSLKQNPSQDAIDSFFVALTEAVRGSLEERYRWPVLSQTTPEFLRRVAAEDKLSAEDKNKLKFFLEKCDAVKFGKYPATLAECEASYQAAVHFFKELK